MNPRNHDQQSNDDQGELFRIETVGSGLTDPLTRSVTHHFEVEPDGFFKEPELEPVAPEPTPEQAAILKSVHEEIAREKHRRAQLGKHSPLQRDGTYLTVKNGDVLPGWGVVYDANDPRVQTHAASLERKRLNP